MAVANVGRLQQPQQGVDLAAGLVGQHQGAAGRGRFDEVGYKAPFVLFVPPPQDVDGDDRRVLLDLSQAVGMDGQAF